MNLQWKSPDSGKPVTVELGGLEMDEEEAQAVYDWVDEVPLSKPKRNIARDFSDGVLMAEVAYHFYPKLVELHGYPKAENTKKKKTNWVTLNSKVFRKMGFNISERDMDRLVAAERGAIERMLQIFRDQMPSYDERKALGKRGSNESIRSFASSQSIVDGSHQNGVQNSRTNSPPRESPQASARPNGSANAKPTVSTAEHLKKQTAAEFLKSRGQGRPMEPGPPPGSPPPESEADDLVSEHAPPPPDEDPETVAAARQYEAVPARMSYGHRHDMPGHNGLVTLTVVSKQDPKLNPETGDGDIHDPPPVPPFATHLSPRNRRTVSGGVPTPRALLLMQQEEAAKAAKPPARVDTESKAPLPSALRVTTPTSVRIEVEEKTSLDDSKRPPEATASMLGSRDKFLNSSIRTTAVVHRRDESTASNLGDSFVKVERQPTGVDNHNQPVGWGEYLCTMLLIAALAPILIVYFTLRAIYACGTQD